MLRDSVVVVVVVVVMGTRPRAIPLAMIAIRKILHGFPFLSRDAYGAPLGGPLGRRSSAINRLLSIALIAIDYIDSNCYLELIFNLRSLSKIHTRHWLKLIT